MLVAVGPGAAAVDVAYTGVVTHIGVAAAFALIVMVMIVTFGNISGAHINPAVTIALWSDGRFPRRDVPAYVLAQCAGGICGAFGIAALLGGAVSASATIPRPLKPASSVSKAIASIKSSDSSRRKSVIHILIM